MSTKNASKCVTENLVCEICDYTCSRKSDLTRHLMTRKHKNQQKTLKNAQNEQYMQNVFSCKCGKVYKERTGLWRHEKKCFQNSTEDGLLDKDNVIVELLKQNKELQKSLIELSKEKSITNNTNNNSHNKTFNLQFFLNEQCKDALNIQDFVSSIKLNLEDLENTGRKGYIEGISNIIIKNLSALEQYNRPIHCSDLKREVIYIKDNNEWTKETEEKPILTKAIKVIANENIKQISEFRKENPDCVNSDSKKNGLYLKIVSNAMSGVSQEETDKNINKIINNVAKETLIDKNDK